MLQFGGGLMAGPSNPIDAILAGAAAYGVVCKQREARMNWSNFEHRRMRDREGEQSWY